MLQVLPPNIANLIAAGEVIQRPASVVKELVENSIDAGATTVSLILEDSGRTLIQVIDNGCGMTPQEAELCFERHATSKIKDAEDLFFISSYGFRGEALPSIASCCDVTLRTRRASDELGCQVHVAANAILESSEAAMPVGTNIAARNIFYNIPARRKFLKSDATEYRQILSEFNKVALTHPEVEFKLFHNGEQVTKYSPVANSKLRITQVAGKDMAKDLLPMDTSTSIVQVSGFIGRPELARRSQPNQYLFVNGRFFKSQMLYRAVLNAYKGLLPEGHIPSYFIYLSIDPGSMDINIHPSKTEIKFEDESVIFEIIQAAAKQTLGKNSMMPSIDFDTEGAIEMPAFKQNDWSGIKQPKINYDPLFNPFNTSSGRLTSNAGMDSSENADDGNFLLLDPYVKEYSTGEEKPKPLKVISNRYLVGFEDNGISIFDALAASQRIVYENYLAHCNGAMSCERLLFPITVEVNTSLCSVLKESEKLLEECGFEIAVSKGEITIHGVPSVGDIDISSPQQASRMIDDILDILQTPGGNIARVINERMARLVARAASAAGAGRNLTVEHALAIERRLGECAQNGVSPFGGVCRKTIAVEKIMNLN